jgi:hypothetical protein
MPKLQLVAKSQCVTHVGPLSPCESWHYVHSTSFLISKGNVTQAKQGYCESG